MAMSLITSAYAAHGAGISIIPILDNGTKSPPFRWAEFMTELPSAEQVTAWFGKGTYTGYAFVCGVASNNLEVLDFDDAGALTRCGLFLATEQAQQNMRAVNA